MKPAVAILFVSTLAWSQGFGAPSAPSCRTVAATGEITTLKIGDRLFSDPAARRPLTVRRIDAELGEICGDTDEGRKCLPADALYSERALAQCRNDALGMGVIFLYGDDEEEAPAPTEPSAD